MGAVDLVIQVESPGAVAAGLQRIGRAGHQVGEPAEGKHLPEAPRRPARGGGGRAAHARRPHRADPLPPQPARRAGPADRGHARHRRVVGRRPGRARAPGAPASPTSPTTCSPPCSTCWPAATRPTSSASCGPASCGTGSADRVRARAGAQRLAVTSGGTIPDRGLFGVFLPDGTRVGELDEEMVYESRPGETFLLGASTWRIEDITFERVIVTPAPGQPGKMPFWHGDGPGRPLELGRALGALRPRGPPAGAGGGRRAPRTPTTASTSCAAANLVAYLARAGRGDRRGARRPHHRGRALPRRDRRLAGVRAVAVRHAGARAVGHGPRAPAGRALRHRRRDACGATTASCSACPRRPTSCPVDELLIDPDEIDELVVVARCPHTPLFASRFRECAARALLLPRRRPDSPHAAVAAAPAGRRPAGGGGQVPDVPDPARGHPRVPATTCSTCPALREVLADLRAATIRVVPRRHPEGVAVRPVPAVRLDRRLHVRGRRAAGRAPGRRAGARPRPAARAARRRGAARADRPRGAGRPRARAAAPGRGPPGPLGRRAARPAAPPRRLSLPELDVRADGPAGRRRRVARAARRRAPGHRRCGSPARSASPPPRTPPASATPSASPLPARAARAPSPTRSSTRSSPRRPLRPHPRPVPRRRRRPPLRRRRRAGAPVPCRRSRPRAASCGASSGPTASSASGATTTCCASCGGGRSPRCARRSSRSSRRALARFLPALAGRRLAAGAASTRLVEALGVLQGAAAPGVRRSRPTCWPRGSAATGRPTSTRCARRARSCGSAPAPLGARDGRVRLVLPRPGRPARAAAGRRRRPPDGAAARRAARRTWRQRGASFWPDLRAGRRRRPPTTSCSPRCGTWCGRARSPTTRSRRCGPTSAGGAAKRGGGGAGGRRPRARPRPGRLTRLGPPAGAGRWSLVAPLLEPRPVAHRGRPRHGPAAARAPRRAHPRGRAGRGRRGRLRRRLPRAQGAGGAGPGAARLLRGRARRRPVRPARRGRPPAGGPGARRRPTEPAGAGRHRSGPALRRRPGLARAERRRPAGPGGRRLRRARRRASWWPGSTGGATTWSPSRRRPRPATAGSRPSSTLVKDGRVRSLEMRKIDGGAGGRVAARRQRCARPGSSTATGAWCCGT